MGRDGTGSDGARWVGGFPPQPLFPVCFVSPPGPACREEEPSPGLESEGESAIPTAPPPRGSSASLVQWFLTVQQFSIIIVKCLGPLDQRGPGIGPAAADESGGSEGPGAAGPPGARSPLTEPGDGGVLLEAGCCT